MPAIAQALRSSTYEGATGQLFVLATGNRCAREKTHGGEGETLDHVQSEQVGEATFLLLPPGEPGVHTPTPP